MPLDTVFGFIISNGRPAGDLQAFQNSSSDGVTNAANALMSHESKASHVFVERLVVNVTSNVRTVTSSQRRMLC